MKKIFFLLCFFVHLPLSALDFSHWSDWVRFNHGEYPNWKIRETGEPLSVELRYTGEGNTKKILILFPKKSSAYDTALHTILNVFNDKNTAADFLLVNFLGDEQRGLKALREAENSHIDLILSMGSSSTSFIQENYRGGRLPVVSVCSKDPVKMYGLDNSVYERGGGENIAYTSLDTPVQLQMKYLLELIPDLKYIVILYAVNNRSAVLTQAEPLKAVSRNYNITCFDIAVQDQSDAARELEKKVPAVTARIKKLDPDLTKSIFWITGSTSVFREIEIINKYADRIPVLSVVPDVVKEGENSAVLSIGVSFENNAYLAAAYAAGILSGEYIPGKLPVGVVTPPDIAVNFLKARQIGLKIPFSFFESATFVYDYRGIARRKNGKNLGKPGEIKDGE